MSREPVILSIDDDAQILYTFQELFCYQGWKSLGARSVEEGIALFDRYRPDLVLMDYHMPKINGVEGVRLLRKKSRHTPIIVFTIDESQAVADAFLEAGASDFALKPIKAPDIISRIKLHLQLLRQQGRGQGEAPAVAKGLSGITLQLIESDLKGREDYASANEIAEGTGLAYQTVYRYLQHLTQEKQVELLNLYGKIGRPKQMFRWLRDA